MHFTMMGGELTIVRAREKAEKTLGAVFNIRARSTTRYSSSARYRCLLSRRGSTASSPKTAEVLTRIWSEQAALAGGADAGSSTSQPEETDQPTYPWSRS